MVCANFRTSLRVVPKQRRNEISIDWSKLQDKGVQARFNLEVKNRYLPLYDEISDDCEDRLQAEYNALLYSIEAAAKSTIGSKARPYRHQWVSEKSRLILEDKERAHIELASVAASEVERLRVLREKVKTLSREAAKSLADDDKREIENNLKELEKANRKHDARSTWKIIKKLAGKEKKRSIRVRSKNGPISDELLTSEWAEYFRGVLNSETDSSGPPLMTLEQPQPQKIDSSRFNTAEFSSEEINEAIKSLKNNKAPGTDNFVTAELLKGAGDYLREVLRSLCNKILSGADPPWQWLTNKIVPVPKKGDLTLMNNYRGISLMSIAAKLYNKMLLERLRPIVDEVLRRNQAGFRRSRSTVDQICALRRIFEGVAYKKIPLVATFVDFKKAFDSVNRARLFEIMQLYGIPDKLIDAVKKLYNGSKAVVAVNGKISESFEVTSGVLQGDVLAPFLFILVMDYVLMRSEEQYGFEYRQASGSRSRRIPARRINDLDFADDIVLLENCIQIANLQLESLRSEAARVGLVINEKKTEVMTFNIDRASSNLGGSGVHLSGVELARMDNFGYFGSMMKSTTSTGV